jgi:hypothetical protein
MSSTDLNWTAFQYVVNIYIVVNNLSAETARTSRPNLQRWHLEHNASTQPTRSGEWSMTSNKQYNFSPLLHELREPCVELEIPVLAYCLAGEALIAGRVSKQQKQRQIARKGTKPPKTAWLAHRMGEMGEHQRGQIPPQAPFETDRSPGSAMNRQS